MYCDGAAVPGDQTEVSGTRWQSVARRWQGSSVRSVDQGVFSVFEVIAYLLVCYFVVGAAAFVVLKQARRPPPPRRRKVRCLAVVALGILPLVPYAVVEGQTRALAGALLPATRTALRTVGDTTSVRAFRVLRVGPLGATTYVVVPCATDPGEPTCYSGLLFRFTRTRGAWTFTGSWDAVWSDCGSASGNVLPPYRAKGDYH